MGWLTTLPAPVIVERTEYHEQRTDPEDADNLQFRKRIREVKEYRGITYDVALQWSNATAGDNASINYTIRYIAANGYTLIRTSDTSSGGWTS